MCFGAEAAHPRLTKPTEKAVAQAEFNHALVAIMPKLRIWALALTRNRAAAEDLAQDVAAKVLMAREQFEVGSNFTAWMHRIMRNHFISGVRARRELVDFETIPEMGAKATHEDHTVLRELSWAVARLPTEQKEAFLGVVVGEDSYEDMAERTGCAIGTLKSRVHRARLHLRGLTA